MHGVPTSSFLYRKLLKSLDEKGFRGIAIDFPGFGLSDRPADFNYSFQGFSEFIARAVKILKLDKFHLVVHDAGGPPGFHFAAAHREKIKSLSILNTWIDVVNFKKPWMMKPLEFDLLGEIELKSINYYSWYIMFSKIGVLSSRQISNEEIAVYVDLLKRKDKGNAFLKFMRNYDDSANFRNSCIPAIQNTPYPVQLIWGAKDPALKAEKYIPEFQKFGSVDKTIKLPSRHLLQEEVYNEIARSIYELAQI
ncbi:alpha/beta hydrolase [Christiangramia fulva]|uniref:alpha/beta hydrolase n=1 Tax=Christiangramia fulva TaxID=2126553 RepID=UPI001F451905|nr:alpha/beta hydrolase [Christiangramia fulva]